MQGQDKIKKIEIFDKNNKLILECTKNYSFPVKFANNQPVDNILMIKGKRMPVLRMGTLVTVIIHTRSADRIKYVCKVDFSGEEQLNVTLHDEDRQELKDNRRYYKIKTEINCRIIDVTRGEEVHVYNPGLYGRIQDINIGGVFIVVMGGHEYVNGDIIAFTAVLGENRLEAPVKVLRVQKTPEGEISGYGCAFVNIASYQEEMISSYINHLQIEERKLEREMKALEKGHGPQFGSAYSVKKIR